LAKAVKKLPVSTARTVVVDAKIASETQDIAHLSHGSHYFILRTRRHHNFVWIQQETTTMNLSFALTSFLAGLLRLGVVVKGQPANHLCSEVQGLPFSTATGGTTFDATPSDEQCRYEDEEVFLSQKAWYNFTTNGNWLR
jgi:hypothetical protein